MITDGGHVGHQNPYLLFSSLRAHTPVAGYPTSLMRSTGTNKCMGFTCPLCPLPVIVHLFATSHVPPLMPPGVPPPLV